MTLKELKTELDELNARPMPDDQSEFNARLDRKNELENLINNYELDTEEAMSDPEVARAYVRAFENRLDRKIMEVEQNLSDDQSELPASKPSKNRKKKATKIPENEDPLPPHDDAGISDWPFKILGIGDDGKANFITTSGRHEKWNLDAISKNKLIVLADTTFWRDEFTSNDGKTSWDWACNDIIRLSEIKDFNEMSIRGRGAWRDGDKISYHDGEQTYGEWDDKKIYLRLPRLDIGINDEPASKDLILKIKEIVFKISFETPADAVRCMAWSALAPFAGGLKFRPAMLLTGESGSGKSTIATLFIKKLAASLWVNGLESTVPGVRGYVQKDSVSIVIEELEPKKGEYMNRSNRDEFFSLMRVSVTDDAPDIIKGTKDGGFHNYKMQNMFAFIAINPTIETIADENRIFRVNMIKAKNQNEWKAIEKRIINLMSEKNCCAIRSLVWQKLPVIFELTNRVVERIREKTHRDYRSSYMDGMLASAFMVIWTYTDNPSDAQIDKMLNKYYSFQPSEDHRDESSEIVDRLLSETIEIMHNNVREKITIYECMYRLFSEEKPIGEDIYEVLTPKEINAYRQTAGRYGVRLWDRDKIAIQNRHHMIKKITGLSDGYSHILKRHPGIVDSNRVICFPDGKNQRCTVLKGLIEKKYEEKTDEEKLCDIIVG